MLKKILILSVLVTSGAWGNESERVKELMSSFCRILVEGINCEKRALTSKNYEQIQKKCAVKIERETEKWNQNAFSPDSFSVEEQRQLNDAWTVLGEHVSVVNKSNECAKSAKNLDDLRACHDSEFNFHFEEFQKKCRNIYGM